MSEPSSASPASGLPDQPIRRLVEPVARFLRVEAVSGIVLLAATIAALVVANSPWEHAFEIFENTPVGVHVGPLALVYSLKDAINDGLMTLFFFVVGLEIKREIVLGELKTLRAAVLPFAGALGGMVAPAILYLLLQAGTAGARGWGVVMATDIAFVVGCLSLFGRRMPHALRVFILSLAIIDDLGAILVIALGYTAHVDVVALAIAAVLTGATYGLQRLGVRSMAVYVVAGLLLWLAVHESGIHATLAGVLLGLLTPARPWVGTDRLQAMMSDARGHEAAAENGTPAGAVGMHEAAEHRLLHSLAIAARETLSPLERLEIILHPWVSFVIMPLFAFANAGVVFHLAGFSDPLAASIAVGLVLGKPLGIFGASWLAVRLGWAVRPRALTWPVLAGAGALAGIGFTMALFVANLAFGPEILEHAKLGILIASLLAALVGMAALAIVLPRAQSEG